MAKKRTKPKDPPKNPAAVALGSLGGKKRAQNLGPEGLREANTKASHARPKNRPKKQPRCYCGHTTLHSAQQQSFACCKKAGKYPQGRTHK